MLNWTFGLISSLTHSDFSLFPPPPPFLFTQVSISLLQSALHCFLTPPIYYS